MPGPFDVVIAGGGPGGSVAALAFLQAGYTVALLDRGTFPRPKICGNCINPRAWKIWRQLGLTESFRALPHAQLEGFTVHSEGRVLHRETFRPPTEGPRAIARDVLDDWLRREVEAAGGEFHQDTAVTGVEANGHVTTTRGDFSGQLVIGADGRNSVIARQAPLMPPPRRCHRVAWQATIPAPAGLDRHVQMYLYEDGYLGFCRYSPTHAVASLVLDSRRSQDPLATVRRTLPDFPEQEWLRMNPITRAPATVGRGRIWLAGDAARVVEPFTGEGIAFALETALLAARHGQAALSHGKFEQELGRYARDHRRLYRRRAWVNSLMRLALNEPARTVHLARHFRPPAALVSFLSGRVHAV